MLDLARKPSLNLQEFMDRANEFVNQEETLRALLGTGDKAIQVSGSKEKKKEQKKAKKATGQKPGKTFQDYNWTPLNAPVKEVLMEIKKDPIFRKPYTILGNHLKMRTSIVPILSPTIIPRTLVCL
jgi:hypothetical protein